MLIAKYTCNTSGVIPTFNNGYVYEVNETENEGIYTVEITSDTDFSSCSFNGKSQLLTVEYLKVTSNVTNMNNIFNGCSSLTSLDVSNFDTKNVTNMYQMFSCPSLTSLDVSNFDTSKVTTMGGMFRNCSKLTSLDLSSFDTGNVTSMRDMFNSCKSLTSLDVSNWDTSNVTTMQGMFSTCTNLTSLDVSGFNTSNVTTMQGMFSTCTNLTSLDVSGFNTSNVTTMYAMFSTCTNLTSLDVSGFNTSNVTNMYTMFYDCNNLTSLDLSNWNTSKVTNMYGMFYNCNNLTSLDLSNFDTSKVTDMYAMFYYCNNLTSLDVSNFDTSKVTDMYAMFASCKNLTSLDVSNFDTSKVTNMRSMFASCNNLTSLDVSNFDTSNVTNMYYMFYYCTNLTSLDVSNFNTSKVTDMSNMFNNCSNLTSIGLIYADINTINKLPTPSISTLYIDTNIDQTAYTGSSKLEAYEQRTVTINIPTALRSNEEIADRIYWNDTDKHYYIEQNINPNTNETLETPNIIASGIKQPIYLKTYENELSVGISNIQPSYMSINVPFFEIPTDYEYKWEDELEYIKQSFELRYPDEEDVPNGWGFMGCDNEEGTGLKALIDWVDNCKDEEFVADFDKHFLKDYTLRYYCLVILIGAVDNLGKNMMLDSADNKIFFPRFYDIDTICSYDNSGQLKFDVDIEMEQGYWNTSTSRLWTRMRELMHDDIVATYNNMRQNGVSYENMMKYIYDEQIAKIPQSYYLKDYDVKYAPFADSYIGMANGDTYEHAKRWLTQRFRFCDSLFDYAPSYNNDVLTIRANTTELMTLEIETYTPVYQHLSWYNNQMDKKKIDGKVATEFSGKAMAATDQEVLIYGGSNVKSIKGIQSMNPNRMLIGSATRLTELDASNCPLLNDINANKANLSPHTYLNKLSLENCPLLDGNLRLNASPLIREINIKGTNISGLNLPSSLRSLEVMKLPKTLTGFTLNDATSLHTLDFEEGVVLNDVSMTNCNALTNVTNFDLSNAQQVTLNNSYNTTNELYLKNASTLSLSNMSNLEKVIYTPNAEHETFDITNLANTKDYNITTFNCPKLTTFMTTAPYRESYNNCEITDEQRLVFREVPISKLGENISLTSGKYISSSGQIISHLNDFYSTEMFIPITSRSHKFSSKLKTTPQEIKVFIYDENETFLSSVLITNNSSLFEVPSNGRYFRIVIDTRNVEDFNGSIDNFTITEWVMSDAKVYPPKQPNQVFITNKLDLSNTQFTDVKLLCTTDTNVLKLPQTVKSLIVDSAYDLDTAYLTDGDYDTIHTELYEPYNTDYEGEVLLNGETPNLIPSASDGSIIQSMYVPSKTVQPNVGVWDLKGLELEEYHTFGLNNNVKPIYGYIEKNIVLEGKDLDWSFSWGAYDKTTILNDGNNRIESITPLNGDNYRFICYDKDDNDIQFDSLVGANVKIMIPENTYKIVIDCYTSTTTWVEFDVVYNVWGVSQIQMPDRYDEYSLSIKNKTVKNEIARYTASDWNTFPTFNSGFTYTYDITQLDDEVYEYSIMADSMDNLPTQISFNNKSGLLTVEYLNVDNVTNMSNMFYGCNNLTSLDVSNFNTSKVTNMYQMFYGCNDLTSLDVSNFDTSKVTDMYAMFASCKNLTSLDVSNFDTSKVTNMRSMFYDCNSLIELDSMQNIPVALDLSSTTLDTTSLLDVIDNLSTVTTTQTLTLGATLLAKLTEEQIAVAVNKGWSVA